jgi:hypothetical protein
VLRRLACRSSVLLSSLLLACTVRHPPDLETGVSPNRGDAAPPGDSDAAAPSNGAGGSSVSDSGTSRPPPPEVLPAGCRDGDKTPCGPETVAGICQLGARTCAGGVWGDCEGAVRPGVRQCSSNLDNDCDGQPDNVVDAVCRCLPGSAEPCETHPGLDAIGLCRAGQRQCVLAADGLSSDWGVCLGSVGPATADSCSLRGDDADCDGTPNGGCACVDGDEQACGSDLGVCQAGKSTCVNSRFGECVGAISPGDRDCSSSEDNDCDGRRDDSIDPVCTCTVDAIEQCNTHPGLDGKGVCRAGQRRCEGRGENNETSTFGACSDGVGPAVRNCALPVDNDCDGLLDNTIDSVCLCALGTQRPCEQHAGQDGNGLCRAGTQLCVPGPNNIGSKYSECLGATGPAGTADSCLVPGNDANCDGVLNGGCACIAGVGCADPAAARCEASGVCAPCAIDSDCSAITGRGICDAGLCVQCTPTALGACAATEVCDVSSRSCTAAPVIEPPVVVPPTPPLVTPPVVAPPVVVAR